MASTQEQQKRRLPGDEKQQPAAAAAACMAPPPTPSSPATPRKLRKLSVFEDDDDAAADVVPPVTVVLDGRSICHRVHLSSLTGYRSLAAALRRMFVDTDGGGGEAGAAEGLDLSNAVPGHVVAYEDMEDDLLLAGDLNWKDFVRVTKRIRIIPTKSNRRNNVCRRS